MNTESEQNKQTNVPIGEPAAVEAADTAKPKKRGLNLPNQLTMFRMLLVPLMVAAFSFDHWLSWWNYLAAGIFFVADMTDIVDGWIARKYNLITNFGKLMDPIADKLLFCSAFILLTWRGELSPVLTIVFIGREIVISGFRLVTAASGTVIAANWLGKLKSGMQVVAILLMLTGNPVFRIWRIPMDQIMMWIAAGLTVWSALDYMLKNKNAVSWE